MIEILDLLLRVSGAIFLVLIVVIAFACFFADMDKLGTTEFSDGLALVREIPDSELGKFYEEKIQIVKDYYFLGSYSTTSDEDAELALSAAAHAWGKQRILKGIGVREDEICLLYTSPSPRDATLSRMPSSA